MPTSMTFDKVKKYLNAIADNPAGSSIDGSPHGRFWDVTYEEFMDGVIPGGKAVECGGKPTPIIDKTNGTNHARSPFYLILTDPNGWCGKPQMPEFGPWITDKNPDYQVTIDGVSVTGAEIQRDLLEWLTNGCPE